MPVLPVIQIFHNVHMGDPGLRPCGFNLLSQSTSLTVLHIVTHGRYRDFKGQVQLVVMSIPLWGRSAGMQQLAHAYLLYLYCKGHIYFVS